MRQQRILQEVALKTGVCASSLYWVEILGWLGSSTHSMMKCYCITLSKVGLGILYHQKLVLQKVLNISVCCRILFSSTISVVMSR